MRRSRTAAIALGLALVVGTVGACNRTPALDTSNLEREIPPQIPAQLEEDQLEDDGAQGGWTVECPDDIKVEVGATFTCEASKGDTTRTLLLTQTDDRGSVIWEFQDPGAVEP